VVFKENCGFRKIRLCPFREDDCTQEKCDMYLIQFTSKDILKQAKKEKKRFKELTAEIKKFKKEGKNKTDKIAYTMMKSERTDKAYGIIKLLKALEYCKRTKSARARKQSSKSG